jgi:hypothetical protein
MKKMMHGPVHHRMPRGTKDKIRSEMEVENGKTVTAADRTLHPFSGSVFS